MNRKTIYQSSTVVGIECSVQNELLTFGCSVHVRPIRPKYVFIQFVQSNGVNGRSQMQRLWLPFNSLSGPGRIIRCSSNFGIFAAPLSTTSTSCCAASPLCHIFFDIVRRFSLRICLVHWENNWILAGLVRVAQTESRCACTAHVLAPIEWKFGCDWNALSHTHSRLAELIFFCLFVGSCFVRPYRYLLISMLVFAVSNIFAVFNDLFIFVFGRLMCYYNASGACLRFVPTNSHDDGIRSIFAQHSEPLAQSNQRKIETVSCRRWGAFIQRNQRTTTGDCVSCDVSRCCVASMCLDIAWATDWRMTFRCVGCMFWCRSTAYTLQNQRNFGFSKIFCPPKVRINRLESLDDCCSPWNDQHEYQTPLWCESDAFFTRLSSLFSHGTIFPIFFLPRSRPQQHHPMNPWTVTNQMANCHHRRTAVESAVPAVPRAQSGINRCAIWKSTPSKCSRVAYSWATIRRNAMSTNCALTKI